MSDDEADPELLELLRRSLGLNAVADDGVRRDTGVLESAEFIYDNSIDVSIDIWGTKSAALKIWKVMQERGYSRQAWSEHELHPKVGQNMDDVEVVNFVFTMDLLNFSFWSELSESERFQVDYKGRRWTGYMSLVACLRRALDESIPITTPRFWRSEQCTDEAIAHVFRSATEERIPLLAQRIAILKEAGQILKQHDEPEIEMAEEAEKDGSGTAVMTTDDSGANEASNDNGDVDVDVDASDTVPLACEVDSRPDRSILRLIDEAQHSAGRLVNILARDFPCFRDEGRFDGRAVRFLKRAQIFVADVWAALDGTGHGEFDDIGELTMFADYRVPQMLHSLGVLSFGPALEARLRRGEALVLGESCEMQLRGCAIWAVELLRRQIDVLLLAGDEAEMGNGDGANNAVLIDFLLYDLAKEQEKEQAKREVVASSGCIPHHRTRSVWY